MVECGRSVFRRRALGNRSDCSFRRLPDVETREVHEPATAFIRARANSVELIGRIHPNFSNKFAFIALDLISPRHTYSGVGASVCFDWKPLIYRRGLDKVRDADVERLREESHQVERNGTKGT